ncbi:acyl-CoA dehydrogenase family protein [Inquilinus sp. CAU 1745]|uniref:acyl-CoA dehydrogenase family protein n=1 Tax=Inquilinus sp. CAU 1745 TaxID=3140369 RepID=UPI00325A6741
MSAADSPAPYPERTAGSNFFDLDDALRRHLARRSPELLARNETRLSDFGGWAGGKLEEQAAYTDRHAPPRLEVTDRDGGLSSRVILNPAYRDCHAEAYRRGAIGLCFGPKAEPHLLSFAFGYLLSMADISIHCPVTMTGAVAHVLERMAPAEIRGRYLPELVRMDGKALSGGTWATERHGGSDIGATTTRAVGTDGGWRLHGLKWFTSNAGSGLALATARPDGAPRGGKGLGCYLVPGHLPGGEPNAYNIRRLKEKLGTRGLPTGEIELEGAFGVEVAGPPDGLRAMMAALEYSRVHNAFGAAGLQARALLEAACWAIHRRAFGRPIANYPMVREALLDIAMEHEASTALAVESGLAFDEAERREDAIPWLRTVTALAKYRTAEQAVRSSVRAVELVGGNGYTEEWPTARLYRDALVTAVWEGPANIQALELLRATTGRLPGDYAFVERVTAALESAPDRLTDAVATIREGLSEVTAAIARLRARPEEGPRVGRRLLDRMSDLLAAALLVEAARNDERLALLAGRFVHRHLGGAGSLLDDDPALTAFDMIFPRIERTG